MTRLILVPLFAVSCLGATSPLFGETEAEKTFQSYAGQALGGVWVLTIDDVRIEHSYQYHRGKKFLQLTAKGGPLPFVAIIGIDPETKKCTWWIFNEDGSVGKDVMTMEKEGVWVLRGQGEGRKGTIRYSGQLVRVDDNTIEERVQEFVVYGEEQETGTFVWKRKR